MSLQLKKTESNKKAPPDIQVIKYTEKSCVVVGDTYIIKDLLKAAGGKWNPRLKQSEDIKQGWIFPISKINVIEALLGTVKSATQKAENAPAG